MTKLSFWGGVSLQIQGVNEIINKTQLETNGKLIREPKWEQENQIWAREEGKHKTQGDRTDRYIQKYINE